MARLDIHVEQRLAENKLDDYQETSGSDIEVVKVEYGGKSGVKVKHASSFDNTYASLSEDSGSDEEKEDYIEGSENPFKK